MFPLSTELERSRVDAQVGAALGSKCCIQYLVVTHVEPSPEHPSPVLLDLESLDIDVGHNQRSQEKDGAESNRSLGRNLAAKRVACNHQNACGRNQDQDHNHVAINSMEQYRLVSNEGDELKDDQERRR